MKIVSPLFFPSSVPFLSSSISSLRGFISSLCFFILSIGHLPSMDAAIPSKRLSSSIVHANHGHGQNDALLLSKDSLYTDANSVLPPRLHPHLDSLMTMSIAHSVDIARRIFKKDTEFLLKGMYPGDLKHSNLYTLDHQLFQKRTDAVVVEVCQKFPQFFFETTFEERRYLYLHPQFLSYLQIESFVYDGFIIPLGKVHRRRLYSMIRSLDELPPGLSKTTIENTLRPYRYDIKGIMPEAVYQTVLYTLTKHPGVITQSYEESTISNEFIQDMLPIIHPLIIADAFYDDPATLTKVLPNIFHTKAFGLLIDYDMLCQKDRTDRVIVHIQKRFFEYCTYRRAHDFPPSAFLGLFLQILITGDYQWGQLPTGDGLAGYPLLPTFGLENLSPITFASSPYRYHYILGLSFIEKFNNFENKLDKKKLPHDWITPFLATMIAYESGHQNVKDFFSQPINYNAIDSPAYSLGITQVLFTYIPHVTGGRSIQEFLTDPSLQLDAYLSLLEEFMSNKNVKAFVEKPIMYPQFLKMDTRSARMMLALLHLCALGNFDTSENLVNNIASHPGHRERFKIMLLLLKGDPSQKK